MRTIDKDKLPLQNCTRMDFFFYPLKIKKWKDSNANLRITICISVTLSDIHLSPVLLSQITDKLYCSLGNFSCPCKCFQGPLHKRHHQGLFVQSKDRERGEQPPEQICGRAAAGNPIKLIQLDWYLICHRSNSYLYVFII